MSLRSAFRAGLVLIGLAGTLAAQQPRDSQRATSTGTGAIRGVVEDDHEGQPLRRALIRLNGPGLESTRVTIAADDGAFAFTGLPAGRYSLHASKAGYVSMNFAAVATGRPGQSVRLRGGQTTAITIRLPRGSVITGTVREPDGEPASGVSVHILESRFDPTLGERRFSLVQENRATTDDRGSYRIFGLPAGNYLVTALPRAMPGSQGALHVLTQAEIRAALADVAATRTTARPGMPAPLPPRQLDAERRSAVNLTPVFFPGTTMQERAAAVTLGAGEVRVDVSFDLQYVPLATISGFVTALPGQRVVVQIASADRTAADQSVRVTSPGEDGRFSFPRIPPGAYAITARAVSAAARSGAMPAEAALWGETQLTVTGDDVEGIALTLQRPLVISGQIAFESDSDVVPDLGLIRIPVNATSITSSNAGPLPSVMVDGSRFAVSGVVPGVYRLTTAPRGIRTPIGRWWLKSIVLNTREALDAELEFRESTDSAVITLSDRASALSGVVMEADGTAADDGFVVVFSTDRRHWFHHSRRIAGAGISEVGRYLVRNLPAGAYHVAVSTDLFVNEWFDPERLARLAESSVTIRIQPDEERTLDLRAVR